MTRGLPLLLVLLLVLTGCGGEQPRPTPKPTYRSFLALGDSYTAGNGIAPLVGAGCGRSGNNYPSLLARELRVDRFTDASCGGSTTAHMVHPQRAVGRVIAGPQGSHLTRDTDLVTIGWGLNNAGASRFLITACLPRVGTARDCRAFLGLGETPLRNLAERIAREVGGVIDIVTQRAPGATVVLVGYPGISAPGETCPGLPVPAGYAAVAHQFLEALHEAYADLAEEKGVRYVDVFTASRGHGVCSGDPWIAPFPGIPGRGSLLHPLDTGHRAVARLVEQDLRAHLLVSLP